MTHGYSVRHFAPGQADSAEESARHLRRVASVRTILKATIVMTGIFACLIRIPAQVLLIPAHADTVQSVNETETQDASPHPPSGNTDRHETDIAEMPFEVNCRSAVLMEASTGKILCATHETEAMPPASVTKIMTLLLIMEAIDDGSLKWTDPVTASARAASMGGSQIFLKEGETMTVEDLIKSVVIASANDAAVALAEHVAGSEEAFVRRMNERAAELGMKDTHFENTNGLDDTAVNHVTSALDIALMSRALIAHPQILKYSSIWMDSVRNGAFGLTNTNRLVRFFRGCNGLKTGSTAKAGFCVSATAERDHMTLICVIMGAESRDIRNAEASRLLDWGFSQYGLFTVEEGPCGTLPVTGGETNEIGCTRLPFSCVLPKQSLKDVKMHLNLPPSCPAPVRKGERIGSVVFTCQGKPIGESPVQADRDAGKLSFGTLFLRMLSKFLLA